MSRSGATVGKGSRVPWILLALLAPALIFTLTLSVRNHSFSRDAAFISVAMLMMLGYAVVGALLASRAPRNPIGWLMMGLALVFRRCTSARWRPSPTPPSTRTHRT